MRSHRRTALGALLLRLLLLSPQLLLLLCCCLEFCHHGRSYGTLGFGELGRVPHELLMRSHFGVVPETVRVSPLWGCA